MSELERLKKNAEESKARQTIKEVREYMLMLAESCEHRRRWYFRCNRLSDFAILSYLLLLGLCIWLDTSREFTRIVTDLHFLVFIVAIIRSWNASKNWHVREGEYRGAYHVLQLLGMVPEIPEGNTKNKKRVYEEGEAMVKKWEADKQKAQAGVYAPA